MFFAICASLKLTDLVSLISIFCNAQDHKLDWGAVATFFNELFLNYALLKMRGLAKFKTVLSTWKLVLFFHNMYIKSMFAGKGQWDISFKIHRSVCGKWPHEHVSWERQVYGGAIRPLLDTIFKKRSFTRDQICWRC